MNNSNRQVKRSRLSQEHIESGAPTPKQAQHNEPVPCVENHPATCDARMTSKPERKPMMIWALMGIAIIVAIAVGLGSASKGNLQANTEPPSKPRALAVYADSVQPETTYETLREYTGSIVARRTIQLGFELGGKVEKIFVDEGDSVADGTPLAKLDTRHLERKRRQFVARRAQAKALLDALVTGPRSEEIAAARAQVASHQAQIELLRLQATRQEKLLAQNATSREQFEKHAFGLKVQEARLDEATYRLDELLNGTRPEKIAAQRAVVDELNASIADIDVDLSNSTLRAPFEGTIARRLADVGTVVEMGQSIFRFVEDQALEARIGLPFEATLRLKKGSDQRLSIGGRHFESTVEGLLPEVDPATRTRTAILKLHCSPAKRAVPGQIVRLQLDETVCASGYWLPLTALTRGSRGLWTCFAVEQESNESTERGLFRVERRDVEVLHTDSDRVFVRGTLNPADRVISRGVHRVVSDQLVRLAN